MTRVVALAVCTWLACVASVPGFGDPGSGIRRLSTRGRRTPNSRMPGPGSRIPDPESRSRVTIDQYLRHLPQRPPEVGRTGARERGPHARRAATSRSGKKWCASCGPASCRPRARDAQTHATLNALVSSLEAGLDQAAEAKPNPGRPLLHRLNRAEYKNAIRDLLALDVDVATLLPPDDSAYGFDNISDVLGVSPSLQERYLTAAGRISRARGRRSGDAARAATPTASRRICRRTSTSRVCRSAPSAACTSATRFRSTASTSFQHQALSHQPEHRSRAAVSERVRDRDRRRRCIT